MTGVFHTDSVFAMNISLCFGIEQFESILVVSEEEWLDEDFAGLVIKNCSTVLEFADINTDVDHDVYTPFDQWM
jgi:hypothetical protein